MTAPDRGPKGRVEDDETGHWSRCRAVPIPLNPRWKLFQSCDGDEMAHHGEHEYSTAAGNDYTQHEGMYEAFLKLTKWTIISVILVLAFLFIFVW